MLEGYALYNPVLNIFGTLVKNVFFFQRLVGLVEMHKIACYMHLGNQPHICYS